MSLLRIVATSVCVIMPIKFSITTNFFTPFKYIRVIAALNDSDGPMVITGVVITSPTCTWRDDGLDAMNLTISAMLGGILSLYLGQTSQVSMPITSINLILSTEMI